MQSWTFDSPDALRMLEIGAELGRSIGKDGLAIALVGPLGAGKTVFVKGLATGLGLDSRLISSPTFVIAQQYVLPSAPQTLHHVDLYRLESEGELESIGFYDMLAPSRVVAVEWADRFPDVLGAEFLSIEFEGPSPEEEDAARQGLAWRGRRAEVRAYGEDAERVLADWAGRLDEDIRRSGGNVVSTLDMRMVSILCVMLGIVLWGRLDSILEDAFERPICGALAAIDSDALGTLHARCLQADAEDGAPLTGIALLLDGGAIDLNRASASLLQNLPGIGPVRATAIVRARHDAAFTSVEDLERVSGIGPKTRMRIEPWVFVAGRGGRGDG